MAISAFADGRLFGTRHGTAPARILALHGWGRTHADFDVALDGLDAIALDLPGFGASPEPDRAGAGSMYAELVAPVLDECSQPVVLVGHSFGGRVAAHLAAAHPEAVASVVFAGVPLLHRADRTGKPALGFRLARLAHRAHLLSDTRMEALRNSRGSAEYRAAQGVMREVFVAAVNESYEEQLAAMRCPAHLIWGEQDEAVPVEVAHRARDLLGEAALTVLDGVDHFVPTTAPQQLRNTIDTALGDTGLDDTALDGTALGDTTPDGR